MKIKTSVEAFRKIVPEEAAKELGHWQAGPFTVKGKFVSMKNGRRFVKFGNRSASIKKQAALDWEQLAVLQVRRAKTPYAGPVALIADFYYHDTRCDLDPNLLLDMLQLKKPGKPCLGIIVNDNQVKRHVLDWHLDKANPRVVFRLEALITGN